MCSVARAFEVTTKNPRLASLSVQSHLNLLASYYHRWKIKVNASNSESMVITRRRCYTDDANNNLKGLNEIRPKVDSNWKQNTSSTWWNNKQRWTQTSIHSLMQALLSMISICWIISSPFAIFHLHQLLKNFKFWYTIKRLLYLTCTLSYQT